MYVCLCCVRVCIDEKRNTCGTSGTRQVRGGAGDSGGGGDGNA